MGKEKIGIERREKRKQEENGEERKKRKTRCEK